jgi:hypothetical protein
VSCHECGADWHDGQTCTDHFHTLLFWEFDHKLFDVHYLLVASYHMQHPALYSPEALKEAPGLMIGWLEQGKHPHQTRREFGPAVQSDVRPFRITGTPEHHGAYMHPVTWTMRVGDVVRRGIDAYYDSTRAWAASILASLRASGNMMA